AAISFCIPKFAEAGFRLVQSLQISIGRGAEGSCKSRHAVQRIHPERVDFDRLAGPRRYDPISDFRIHPSELHAGAAAIQQAVVGVDMYVVASSLQVCADDFGTYRKKFVE